LCFAYFFSFFWQPVLTASPAIRADGTDLASTTAFSVHLDKRVFCDDIPTIENAVDVFIAAVTLFNAEYPSALKNTAILLSEVVARVPCAKAIPVAGQRKANKLEGRQSADQA